MSNGSIQYLSVGRKGSYAERSWLHYRKRRFALLPTVRSASTVLSVHTIRIRYMYGTHVQHVHVFNMTAKCQIHVSDTSDKRG
jgi:hypothetical protein